MEMVISDTGMDFASTVRISKRSERYQASPSSHVEVWLGSGRGVRNQSAATLLYTQLPTTTLPSDPLCVDPDPPRLPSPTLSYFERGISLSFLRPVTQLNCLHGGTIFPKVIIVSLLFSPTEDSVYTLGFFVCVCVCFFGFIVMELD